MCRICQEGDEQEVLVSPCYCAGTMGLLHISCLQKWLGCSNKTSCEICKFEFLIERRPMPISLVSSFLSKTFINCLYQLTNKCPFPNKWSTLLNVYPHLLTHFGAGRVVVCLSISTKVGMIDYKNLPWVWGWNRKVHPLHSLFGITSLVMPNSDPRDRFHKRWLWGTDFSIPSAHKC